MSITLMINGQSHILEVAPDTPLLYVLRNVLNFMGQSMVVGANNVEHVKS